MRQLEASIPDGPVARLAGAIAAGALLAAICLPARRLARRQEARDSFPFSHYPMFSAPRKDTVGLVHMLGRREDGTSTPLHHGYLGPGGLNQVRRQIRRRVREGDGQLLAERAATELARRDRPEDRDVRRVDVVRARYSYPAFLAGSRTPLRIRVAGSAPVPGREER